VQFIAGSDDRVVVRDRDGCGHLLPPMSQRRLQGISPRRRLRRLRVFEQASEADSTARTTGPRRRGGAVAAAGRGGGGV